MLSDVDGNLVLMFSVVAAFLLVLGLPLVRGLNNRQNLKRHGMLTVVALLLQAILILAFILPSFIGKFNVIVSLSPTFSVNTWIHIILGSAAFISGLAYIALWLAHYSSGMGCAKAKKYMFPTLIIWILALVGGSIIYLFQMF